MENNQHFKLNIQLFASAASGGTDFAKNCLYVDTAALTAAGIFSIVLTYTE